MVIFSENPRISFPVNMSPKEYDLAGRKIEQQTKIIDLHTILVPQALK